MNALKSIGRWMVKALTWLLLTHTFLPEMYHPIHSGIMPIYPHML